MRMSVIASVTSHRLLDLTDVRSSITLEELAVSGALDTEFADSLRDNIIRIRLLGLFIQSLHPDSRAKEPS